MKILDVDSIMIPSFKDHSFIELTFRSDENLIDFSIDLEFKSSDLNGLLLYASQYIDGSGDFISLLLRNGFIEMRFIFCLILYI
jgi:hypothetical protein